MTDTPDTPDRDELERASEGIAERFNAQIGKPDGWPSEDVLHHIERLDPEAQQRVLEHERALAERHPPDLDSLTPRQMVAGLMRGDREELKRGYAPRNAVRSTADFKNVDAEQRAVLQAYAEGFSDGMADSIERTDPAVQYERFRSPTDRGEASRVIVGASPSVLHYAYEDGLSDGMREDGLRLYPSIREVDLRMQPRPLDGQHRHNAAGA